MPQVLRRWLWPCGGVHALLPFIGPTASRSLPRPPSNFGHISGGSASRSCALSRAAFQSAIVAFLAVVVATRRLLCVAAVNRPDRGSIPPSGAMGIAMPFLFTLASGIGSFLLYIVSFFVCVKSLHADGSGDKCACRCSVFAEA